VKEAKREERRRRWRRLTHGFGNMLMNGTIRNASTPRELPHLETTTSWVRIILPGDGEDMSFSWFLRFF